MPTYDYRCPNGHDFEHFVRKISDAQSELTCPQCGAVALRRVSGGAGLVFKGSGFYLTDYGKNAHRKGGADAGSSSKSESSGDAASTKSESKSDGSSASSKADSSASGTASASPKAETSKSESKPAPKPKGGDA